MDGGTSYKEVLPSSDHQVSAVAHGLLRSLWISPVIENRSLPKNRSFLFLKGRYTWISSSDGRLSPISIEFYDQKLILGIMKTFWQICEESTKLIILLLGKNMIPTSILFFAQSKFIQCYETFATESVENITDRYVLQKRLIKSVMKIDLRNVCKNHNLSPLFAFC